jgi:hypothetical protein
MHSCPLHSSSSLLQTVLSLFLSDPLAFTLLIHKRLPRVDAAASAASGSAPSEDAPLESYTFDLQLRAPSPNDTYVTVGSLAIIKSTPSLDLASAPIGAQLLLITMHEANLFESMLTYVRHAFLPYTRAWIAGGGGEEEKKEADLGKGGGTRREAR